MSQFEIYVFILCLIVFVLLTVASTIAVVAIVKMKLRIIDNGLEDDLIKTEYIQKCNQEDKKGKKFECMLSLVFSCIIVACFAFSIFANVSTKVQFENVPSFFVVKSASMAKKHEKNKYLVENDLNNQFQTHDLIFVYKAPDQFELKLYDIVVYEVDEILLIHRIVAIEEPNENHPNDRYFLCQGDAVETPDRFPVKYEQIRGIYRDQNIPFVGSFVSFFQAPAGWLCIFLLLASIILTPFIEKIIKKASDARLKIILDEYKPFEGLKGKLFLLDMQKRIVCGSFSGQFACLSSRQKDWYYQVISKLSNIEGIIGFESLGVEFYKVKKVAIAKIVINNKKLELYFAVKPRDLVGTKYKISNIGRFDVYPKRVHISSDRMLKQALELIDIVCEKRNLTVLGVDNED